MSLILNTPVCALSFEEALETVALWASQRESRCVVFLNVHSLMTGHSDPSFRSVLDRADRVLPDGAPIAWLLKLQGYRRQQRLNGPDFMWRYLANASLRKEKIFLLGGTPETLAALRFRIETRFKGLVVAGSFSPPFRPLTLEEDDLIVQAIHDSGAQTVWVGLGCPKQERWMINHQGKIRAVMLGVGAAFNYHAGTLQRAPRWMQQAGLEWAYRLAREPRALWRRYLVTNSLFLWRVLLEGGKVLLKKQINPRRAKGRSTGP